MSLLELFAIAVALSLDAFAVATCAGCTIRGPSLGHYARLAGAFGFFQFLMPLLGWYLGASIYSYIEEWDHWIAFALLAWVGGSMLRSALSSYLRGPQCAVPEDRKDPTCGSGLLVLAVATSIDALAVGLSFSMLGIGIWGPALLIGCVCGAISALGLLLGTRLANLPKLSSGAEIIGGVALIGIGINILHEHNVF